MSDSATTDPTHFGADPAGTDWQRERRWLGYAGLVPFLACVAVIWADTEGSWRAVAVDTLRGYAAVIASFLGAVHWGASAGTRDGLQHARLRWGIVPALLAWALLALPDAAAFAGLAVLFLLILAVDRSLLPILDPPYRRLRLHLSSVVVATMLVAAWLSLGGTA